MPLANDTGSLRTPLYSEQNATLKVLTDINGDGLPDLVCSRPSSGTGHWDVWLNTGSGFLTSPISWAAPPFSGNPYALDDGPYVSRALRDMNGDGLPDYVDSTTSPWTVYLNTGAGFNTGVSWAATVGIPYLSKNYVYNTNPPTDDVARTITQVFDINGDGLADYVDTSGELGATYRARYGVAPRNNLFIHQDNGMGGTADLAYVASTDPSTAGLGCVGGTNPGAPCMTNAECTGGGTCMAPSPDSSQLPFATWVAQTLTVHSGLTGTGNDITTSFAYTDGYFDPTGHQFRGFMQSVETRAADGRKIRRQFRPPPYTLGVSPPWYSILTSRPFKLIAEEVWSGAQVLTRATIDWYTPYIGGGQSQIHSTKRVDTTFSTATGVTTTKVRTETFNTYDTYNNIDTLVREPNAASGSRTVSTFYDSFGRPLETKQQQYVGLVGSVVAKDAVAFDSAGRVATRFTPFTTAAAVTTYTSPSTSGTTLAYDTLDRVTRTTNPDATYRTADYSTAGQTTALDENYNECATPTGKTASCPGAKTVEYRDALGRAFKSELSEGSTLKTRTATAYDGLNRVTSTTVTDTIANKTATTGFEYDSFSRRTKMTDSDSGPPGPSPPAAPGVWLYAYDNASNVVYQDDPKTGQHIEFCYDVLNRVTRKLYPAGDTQQSAAAYASACSVANPAAPVLQYWYDALNDAQHPYTCDVNGIGRLCAVDESFVDTSSLRTIFIYDARGRVSREYNSRSMLGKSGVYTRTNIYDFADRLTGVTYPTNFSSTSETVQYAYDDFGQLDLVNSAQQTYASGMSYDIFGRNTLWIDGSGLRNTASFGSSSFNFRLTQLKVADAGSTTYQQFDYNNNYDVASNLKTLTDNTPTTRYASSSPLRNSWTYLYDGLGRLTSGQLTGASATAFTYDGLGNMTGGNQLTFAYTDTTHPHHITSLTPGGSVSYHDDGGLASRPDTDGAQPDVSKNPVTYDADGRVATITTGDGHTIRSLYDFRGERVARIVDQGLAGQVITFYYGKWFDVTGGTLTRHMYLPGRLIADSPVAAPAGLTVARISDEERSIMLARAMHDAARWSPAVYPNYVLTAEEAAKLGGLIAFILLVLGCTPGRVRVGLAVARQVSRISTFSSGQGGTMPTRSTVLALIAWLSIGPCGLCETAAQELEFYVPAAQSPPQSASKLLTVETGEPFGVAIPPVATVKRESVLRVHGVRLPVEIEPGAEHYVPDPHSYRVVLDLDEAAQHRFQTEVNRRCSPGTDLQIVIGGTIVSHVVLLACGRPFEVGATFPKRSAAEAFARYFTDQPIRFQEPTPARNHGGLAEQHGTPS